MKGVSKAGAEPKKLGCAPPATVCIGLKETAGAEAMMAGGTPPTAVCTVLKSGVEDPLMVCRFEKTIQD